MRGAARFHRAVAVPVAIAVPVTVRADSGNWEPAAFVLGGACGFSDWYWRSPLI